ncbi:hypothetical protein [Clostridium sp. LIBA-8841]|uniref:hypothetical protein n=1 Tax=Clostridium sp. LIBA-8841 TaxID=2987530 RepID=UPI002AC65A2A|nr:hypothetical protein [Clostridium sp. LIBA-8841]MDZ5255167.1 hypothetical protein [Clostridium sp. LIBA-8841]
MSKLDFNNKVKIKQQTTYPIVGSNNAEVNVMPELRLFRYKYSYQENDPNPAGNGDDIGFSLVFGNYGELSWETDNRTPTLEDTLVIEKPVNLKLMHLCLPCGFKLYMYSDDMDAATELQTGMPLIPGTYTLQLRKCEMSEEDLSEEECTPYFDVPCHFICCISMLFQVEFPPCSPDSDSGDCSTSPISNGDFEESPHGVDKIPDWEVSSDDGKTKTVKKAKLKNISKEFQHEYTAPLNNYFALLSADSSKNYDYISQSFEVCAGDKIEGHAFFFNEGSSDNGSSAEINILDNESNIAYNLFTGESNNSDPGYGSTYWEDWSYTFEEGGSYTIRCEVDNGENEYSSYLGVDAVNIITE